MTRRHKPTSFSSLAGTLPKVLRRLGLEDILIEQKVLEKWTEIAGEQVASHTRIVKFEKGILTISADDMIWVTQLKYLKPQLLKGFTRAFGRRKLVTDIRFVLSR